jgi:hypothetical protein
MALRLEAVEGDFFLDQIDSPARALSFSALNTGPASAFVRNSPDRIRADAERLSHIVLGMQRCFMLHLCKELAPGNVSFPQFFLLTYLEQKEVSHHRRCQRLGREAGESWLCRPVQRPGGSPQGDGLHYRQRIGSSPANPGGNGRKSDESPRPFDTR